VAHVSFKQPIRAVLLDVDGTLYYQRPLRVLMALELCALPLTKPSFRAAYHTWRSIRHFRRVREELRSWGEATDCLARLQYTEAAKQTQDQPAAMENTVSEWLYQRPLKYLKLCRHRGIEAFLSFLDHRGLPVGVFSDYPAIDKLRALGLFDRIPVVLCATDPAINALKPHPKGFLRACAIWGLPPEEVLYVGDRPEVDAVGAAAAGMPCAILSRKGSIGRNKNFSTDYVTLSSFQELQQALANSG
jgi:HAD superfamily hydrolase (TIGR01549 family)